MHIQFTKLRYKNLLSTGNIFTELELEGAKTTLISGRNGCGKSSMLDAIAFVLYNKPLRKINKPQLINSINNKELLVELEFKIAKDKFMIRRGMKPTVFEIWKNGELLNKDAASRDYQQYLEENIIKMSYKSFGQIVVLGSATYVPFMELPTGARREIIEDLLDIQIFTTMNNLLRERITENKTQIQEANHQITLLETKLAAAKEHNSDIEKLKKLEVAKIKAKMRDTLDSIEAEQIKVNAIATELEALNQQVAHKPKVLRILSTLQTCKRDLELKRTTLEHDIGFYHDHDSCPTCRQTIEHEFKQATVADKQSELQTIETALVDLTSKLESQEAQVIEIQGVEHQIQRKTNEANEHRLQIRLSTNQLKTYKKELDLAEQDVVAVDTTKISELSKELKAKHKEQESIVNDRELLALVAAMLKDGGIKTSIIKTYIPIMNKIINQYLSEFELFVDFNLDENFNEKIKSRFRDEFSFSSFSEGEKMRISLAIMFTWRAVAKLRNSVSTNLLILDEILDGPSDAEGVESIIEILHKVHVNDNVFVISHRGEQFGEKFERHIRFEKVKNFSQLAA